MKKLCVVMLAGLALCSVQSFGQTKQAEIGGTTFGIRAGVNFQNINGKDAGGDRLENKLKTGFNVGVNAEIPVAPEFYVQPGLLFTTKGASFDQVGSDDKLNLSYLELPVNFLYKPQVGTGKLLVGLGPYLAYGIGGKVKSDGDKIDVKFKNKIEPGEIDDNAYFKPFDAGANFLFGYEFANRLSAQLNAQLGLLNINTKVDGAPSTDARSANTGFGVSVGYRF